MSTATEPTRQSAFDALRTRLRGKLHLPGEPGYVELATPWNVGVSTTPAAVVAAETAQDVAEAVRFAAHIGIAVAVQATGHGVADPMAGALLVHTGRLGECFVHPQGWARVGAGVRWRAVLDAAAPYGLAPLCGSAPAVGVIGYTTGGGVGPVARTYGAASDRVKAFELVTGDGELRRVTPETDPDLFWGVRGGKGALGIVTAMEFDLVPLAEVYGGALFFDGADAPSVLHAWREWCAGLPEQATTSVALLRLPPLPSVPPPLAGRLTVAVRFVWTGESDRGARLLAPLYEAATPVLDTVGVLPYSRIGEVHADPVDPMPVHEETDLLRELPPEAVDALLAVAGSASDSPLNIVELRQLGGAFARPPARESALCHRDAAFSLLTIGLNTLEIRDEVVRHSGAVRAALRSWATGGALPNFGTAAGGQRLARSYDPSTLRRLTDLAKRYDPSGVFRVGQVPQR